MLQILKPFVTLRHITSEDFFSVRFSILWCWHWCFISQTYFLDMNSQLMDLMSWNSIPKQWWESNYDLGQFILIRTKNMWLYIQSGSLKDRLIPCVGFVHLLTKYSSFELILFSKITLLNLGETNNNSEESGNWVKRQPAFECAGL